MLRDTKRPLLLVEDSERDSLAMEVLLRSLGVRNHIVRLDDGEKALAYLSGAGEFDDRDRFPLPGILLLDLRMPKVDGFDVLEWMRMNPTVHRILIVVLSAYDGLREVKHAYSLGAQSFLVKPCSASDVQNIIQSFPEFWTLSPDHEIQCQAKFNSGLRTTGGHCL